MELGQKLKHFRQEKGLTQLELSEKMGVSRQTLSNWENSRTLPDGQSLVYLADAYGVSMDELVGRQVMENSRAKKTVFQLILLLGLILFSCLVHIQVFHIVVMPFVFVGMLLFFTLRDFLHH